MADSNNVVISFVGNDSQLQATNQQVQKDLIKTGKVGTQAMQDFNKSNQDVVAGTKVLATNLQDLNKIVATGAVKEMGKDLADVTVKHISLRGQVMALKQGLVELAEQGKKGTQAWNEQKAALEKAATQLRELNKLTANLGSQTKVFAGLIDAARGVAAGFEIAKGATVLFGADSKKAEEVIKELVSVMAILNGLQEIQLLLKEDSAAMQLILNAQESTGVAIKKLQIAAESENIIVSKAATAAQWALNLAMEANPVMLLVGAIVAAVAALLYFTSASNDAKDGTIKLTAEQKNNAVEIEKLKIKYEEMTGAISGYDAKIKTAALDTKKALDDIQEKIDEKIKGNAFTKIWDFLYPGQADLRKMARTAEAYSENAKTIEQIREQAAVKAQQDRFEELDRLAQMEADNNAKEEKKAADALKKRYDAEIKAAKDNVKALAEIKENRELEAKLGEEFNLTMAEIDEDFRRSGFEKFKDYEKQKRNELEQTTKKNKDELNQRLHDNEELEKAIAENDKQYQDEAQRHQKELANIELQQEKAVAEAKIAAEKQAVQEIFKMATEIEVAIFTIKKNNRDSELAADIAMYEKRKDKELSNKHLTAEQTDAINEKYRRIEAAAKLKAWKAEQKAAETQAAIKMALGVVNAWATSSSWVQALIVTAAVIAAGSAEIAVIAAQKPPQFATGTEFVERGNAPRGTDTIHAMLNEGERVVPTHINEKLRGISNEDLPKLLTAMPHAPDISDTNFIIAQPAIDYDKLGTVIAEKLRANPQTVINMDKGGISHYMVEQGRKIEKLNNRYSS